MNLNKAKYKNAIMYLCLALGGELHGKKKLAKLLYFADFDMYEKSEQSITGVIYEAWPMGPMPQELDEITQEMVNNHELNISQVKEREGYNPTEIYTCLVKHDYAVFNDDEMDMLDRIILKYGHLTGKQLEELSHLEAPYVGTELKHEIAYELAHYRDTDFSDL